MMKYKAVIFDLDGTLLDTIEDIGDSMNRVLLKNGCPAHDMESYKYFVGDGMRSLAARALPPGKRDAETVEMVLAAMKDEYGRRWDIKTRPYPGVPDMLDSLARLGLKLSILSNKSDDLTNKIVKKLLPSWRFFPVFGERPGVPRKPDPSGAFEIARLLGVKPDVCLYLGDTGIDMKTASAAGMFAVGALWGYRNAKELSDNGARVLVSTPLEVLSILRPTGQPAGDRL